MIRTTLLLLAALAARAGDFAITCGPYLQDPSETSMTVMWVTSRNATGWVEFGEPGRPARRVFSSRHGLIDANCRIHRVTLPGLKPGATYEYRVFSKDILDFGPYKVQFGETAASRPERFTTLDRGKRSFSFLVFTDIHEHREVLPQMMAAAGPGPFDLVVFDGDMLSHIEREEQITTFIGDAVKQFASRVPFVWVRGNHETRGSFARRLPEYVASPGGNFYWSFDHGPAHFVVLDTGEDKEDGNVSYSGLVDFDAYRREQADWLRRETASPAWRGARFRIALAHMPFPLPAGQWHGPADAFRNFGGLLGSLDMLISGHRHTIAVDEPKPGIYPYPIVRGGAFNEASRSVIRVAVSREALKAEVVRPDGSIAVSTARKSR